MSCDDGNDFSRRWMNIPKHLQLRIIRTTADYIVIEKPCNLRSVPGNASGPLPPSKDKRTKGRRTAQEAWTTAIQSFGEGTTTDQHKDVASQCLQSLQKLDPKVAASIPRKMKLFRRYMERNQKRVLPSSTCVMTEDELDRLTATMFQRIEGRQRPLMNLPKPTKLEESALGQLTLLGHGVDTSGNSRSNDIKVVHRLDCETSGVMVFARNAAAAAYLSKAWRERDCVEKRYYAEVKDWPPYHKYQQTEGTIDVKLEPSAERLKWKVSDSESGKETATAWKVSDLLENNSVILDLRPITGRTHQLRIHCAHIGSGIIGDSLYGLDCAARWNPSDSTAPVLRLHASKLCFRDPQSHESCEFTSFPWWYNHKQNEIDQAQQL